MKDKWTLVFPFWIILFYSIVGPVLRAHIHTLSAMGVPLFNPSSSGWKRSTSSISALSVIASKTRSFLSKTKESKLPGCTDRHGRIWQGINQLGNKSLAMPQVSEIILLTPTDTTIWYKQWTIFWENNFLKSFLDSYPWIKLRLLSYEI